MTDDRLKGLEVRSIVLASGELQITLEEAFVADPGPDEVVVRVEASPLNPSDIGLLFGAADLSTARLSEVNGAPRLTATVPANHMPAMAGRVDQAFSVGNEGAGTVVKAGTNVQGMLGKTVGMSGGAMYAQYRKLPVADCIVLPAGATAADGASMFVNPLTALAMVETMRSEGHHALVHTAAASNLGQMLVKICLADGVGLVNVVRNSVQAELLRAIGATHVVDTSAPDFVEALTDAVAQTGSTLCFDAIGGGAIASTILNAMENAAQRTAGAYSRYGSSTFKQVYIYGGLDISPTHIDRRFGLAWGISGFLVMHYLEKIGPDATMKLRERVTRELKTTFASQFTRTISLQELLQPDVVTAYSKRATGKKYLLAPHRL